MKIVISDRPPYFLDLDAPTVAAHEAITDGVRVWRIWCRYCQIWHVHGPGEGHRIAHCDLHTPYRTTGYNLTRADHDA